MLQSAFGWSLMNDLLWSEILFPCSCRLFPNNSCSCLCVAMFPISAQATIWSYTVWNSVHNPICLVTINTLPKGQVCELNEFSLQQQQDIHLILYHYLCHVSAWFTVTHLLRVTYMCDLRGLCVLQTCTSHLNSEPSWQGKLRNISSDPGTDPLLKQVWHDITIH